MLLVTPLPELSTRLTSEYIISSFRLTIVLWLMASLPAKTVYTVTIVSAFWPPLAQCCGYNNTCAHASYTVVTVEYSKQSCIKSGGGIGYDSGH